ncbi:MAG: NAD-glutamate dehydrogenase [Acidimicrobiales bacterium]
MGTAASEVRADVMGRITAHAAKRLTDDQLAFFTPFVGQYYAATDPADLTERRIADLYGAAMAHMTMGMTRQPSEIKVRAYAPDLDRYGFVSQHTIIEVVSEDVPFLVDSVSMEVSRHRLGIHLIVHPVLCVERDDIGQITAVGTEDGRRESFIHLEVNRETDEATLDELRDDIERVVGDVMAAVQDWAAMRQKAIDIAAELAGAPGNSRPAAVDEDDSEEVAELLRWLADGHFVFLGYREYELDDGTGEVVLRARVGSGLGILRQGPEQRAAGHSFAKLPPEVRRRALEPVILNVTKASSRSTVHRPSYLDYVGVKGFDDQGTVVSERRFLGLYTTNVYKQWPDQIPLLRRKVAQVVERAGFEPASHSGKALREVLDGYPRDELFQISADELFEQATAILGLQDRERLRLLVRHDDFGRFVSCLVFLPRNRLTPVLEQRIQTLLLKAFGGIHLEYAARVGESVLARLHLVIYTETADGAGNLESDADTAELEALLTEAMRLWSDDLRDVLVADFGEERGLGLYRSYGDAFPNSYMEDFSAQAAVSDLKHILSLPSDEGGFTVNLYRPIESPENGFRLKLYQARDRMTLSTVLPLLENMGLQVGEERPYEVSPMDGATAWIYDFGLRSVQPAAFDSTEVRDRFQHAFLQVWRGTVDNDAFNRLVLGAGLPIRDVIVLRAYARYLRQAGTTFSLQHIAMTLANNPVLARQLLEIFHVRHDPDAVLSMDERGLAANEIVARFEMGLDAVANLNEDQVLRRMLGVVQATLRTNFYQIDATGGYKPWLSIKLNPALVPDCPLPRPMFETFVYSPRVEGVHMRTARVARGGLRWSDRLEDYRTEILGLMKAQAVKNAVIVPGGAKGGFVLKAPPSDGYDALQAEAIACYQTFIRALLDVADNLVGGEVAPPARVVRHDSDDPYLVVAADKGTATFSDIANAISLEYGFWLGDAFASGGSSGYDHKAMGITAKGAFVSVRRHFRDMGVDVSADPVSVVGIGDMSGDVFGNGMLLSQSLRLVAAFDHRHIFIDPDPEPATSFAERARMFELPRSSWADYAKNLISAGGGIYKRTSKTVPLSARARTVLGLEAGDEPVRPDDVIKAILRAPVDLLWNGGIGTYVKSSAETNAEAGDKTNDGVRVNGSDLRCRVVGEGGNLGFTQLGRIEFALAGGRINTDAIDNSAGVDTSDHEVNIKILLGRAIDDGALTMRQRDDLLAEMTDDIAAHVLEDNDGQTRVLYSSVSQSLSMLDVHARTLSALERSGLNRAIEFLPSDEELRTRGAVGRGLTMPELAVVLAYAKAAICSELLASDLPEDPYFAKSLELYFPPAVRARHLSELLDHPLRREIVATVITNSMVNRAGTTLVFRLADETGCSTPDIARAHFAAWEMFGMDSLWAEIEALDSVVPAPTQVELVLEARKLVERACRWLLVHRRLPLDVNKTVLDFAPGLTYLAEHLVDLVGPADAAAQAAAVDRYVATGTPLALAHRIAGLSDLFSGLDLADIARGSSCSIESAAAVYFALGERLWLDWLRDRILALPRGDRWQALARAAVREDLYSARAAMTAEVLSLTVPNESGSSGAEGNGAEAVPGGSPDESGPARVAAWLGNIGGTADRSLVALDEIAASGRSELATVAVALQEIRKLLKASGPLAS